MLLGVASKVCWLALSRAVLPGSSLAWHSVGGPVGAEVALVGPRLLSSRRAGLVDWDGCWLGELQLLHLSKLAVAQLLSCRDEQRGWGRTNVGCPAGEVLVEASAGLHDVLDQVRCEG